jgi:hypothetical protein
VDRRRRVRSWNEARAAVARARRLAEDCGFADAHPDEYLPANKDRDDWDKLLRRIK